jgi:hypothetical protein
LDFTAEGEEMEIKSTNLSNLFFNENQIYKTEQFIEIDNPFKVIGN